MNLKRNKCSCSRFSLLNIFYVGAHLMMLCQQMRLFSYHNMNNGVTDEMDENTSRNILLKSFSILNSKTNYLSPSIRFVNDNVGLLQYLFIFRSSCALILFSLHLYNYYNCGGYYTPFCIAF